MSSHKHILCPTDFSSCSDEACAHAAELATESGAKLTLLHVVAHFPEDRSNEEIAPENQDPMSYHREKALAAIKEQAARVGCPNAELAVVFTEHASGYGIIHHAATSGADLIVIASHERHGLEGIFGDTATYVQRKAECEVLQVSAG